MKDPVSGLRAACTKLIKTNFAPPPPFLQQATTLATRDVLKNPRFRRLQPQHGRFAI